MTGRVNTKQVSSEWGVVQAL